MARAATFEDDDVPSLDWRLRVSVSARRMMALIELYVLLLAII